MAHIVHHHTYIAETHHHALSWLAAVVLGIIAITAFYFGFSSTDTAAVESFYPLPPLFPLIPIL